MAVDEAFGVVDGVDIDAQVLFGDVAECEVFAGEERELELVIIALDLTLVVGGLFPDDLDVGVVLAEPSDQHGLDLEVSLGGWRGTSVTGSLAFFSYFLMSSFM